MEKDGLKNNYCKQC